MIANRQAATDVDSLRKTAMVTGVLFVITYVTSIPARLFLYARTRQMHEAQKE